MRDLQIKNIVLGKGRPKIAVPITGKSHEQINSEVAEILKGPCDILEWRADYFFGEMNALEQKVENTDAHMEMIRILDDIDYQSDGMPLIFTIRGKDAGGKVRISREHAFDLASLAAQSKMVDFVDIELFDGSSYYDEEQMLRMIKEIHEFGVRVILSYHDYSKMPVLSEVINLGNHMRTLGADIVKIAGTAAGEKEAMDILKAAAFLTEGEGDPVIIIAMGIPGLMTRVAGGKYGSCISYARGREATAAGQVDARTLNRLLNEYYVE